MNYQVCKICKENKPISEYHKNREKHLKICRICRSKKRKSEYATDEDLRIKTQEKQRNYNADNSEKIKAYNKAYYENNKDSVIEKVALHYKNNKHRIKEYQQNNRESINTQRRVYIKKNFQKIKNVQDAWRKANRHKLSKNQSKRVAAQRQAIPSWSNTEWEQFAIEEVYELCKLRTSMLGITFNVDHIVPIASDKVCGLHCFDNLRILERIENISKGNRHWPNMWV